MKKILQKFNKKKKGFVVLFAIILSTILLSISLGISQIALKEVQFTTNAVDADNAFYSADAGVECALYLDYNAASSASPFVTNTYPANCGNLSIFPYLDTNDVVIGMTVNDPSQIGQCANVFVSKVDDGTGTGNLNTSLVSRGYVIKGTTIAGQGDCLPNTGSTERELDVTY